MITALFVETEGAYFGLPDVEPWDEARDARCYTGPRPVVAHPPCQRWGRYWHGAPNKPNKYRLGEDQGCFAAALTAVRNYGGVLEHPAHSNAWRFFGLATPPKAGGWVKADEFGGWTCHVEQGHYGHMSRKATWLYAVGTDRPELKWGPCEQRLHPVALARYGYEKARRIGMMAMVGGKDKTRIRNATPPEFRDLLLEIAASANKTPNRERTMPPSRAEQRRTRRSIIEQIKRLSKEELLELLEHPLLFFPIGGLSTADINAAKGRVLRRKAEAEFKIYEDFRVQIPGEGAGLTSFASYFKSLSEKKVHFERYLRLCKRADHLEFGDRHAAE